MRSVDARVGTLTASLMLSVLLFSGVAIAQAQGSEAEDQSFVFFCCIGPFLLIAFGLAAFGILWSVFYPVMFLYGAIFSERNMDRRMGDLVLRERASIDHFGKDPLSTLKGDHIVGGVKETGLVYASVVFAPSHWQLFIAWINMILGGRVDVLHRVISVGRAEAKQRLREQAQADGWQDVLNVRIDTAEMTPASSPKGTKAVEVFAYGTGVKLD